ncbi:MAG: amidohydrolase family protein [Solibacillus sp.]
MNSKGTLAGSSLNMIEAVKNCVHELAIPIDEALRMASTYPAKAINMGHTLGKIKEGYLANLTIFNDSYEVEAVVINGNYSKC